MKKGSSPDVAKTAEKGTVPFLAVFAIEGVAAVALGVAALAVWLGGWHTEFLGVSLSVRAVSRPLFLVAALLALRWFLTPRVDRRRHFADAGARVVAGALVTAGVLAWTTYVSPYLGGADSYGYVSASERLRAGTLIQPEPLASVLPYPDAIFPATPLGYVPAARQPGASVPAYPLGLPALMALATEIAGPRAPFYVALVMGLVLMATCYGIVYRWTREPVIALAASGALAFHPVVFAYAIQAMSDVPATALFLLAAACLMSERPGLAFLGGLAGALAFITRPALFPGTAALALIAIISGRNSTRRVTGFAAALAIGVVVQLALQWYLYGHPLGNGYGGASDLFSFGHLPTNLRSYTYWSVAMHGSFWLVAFVLGLWLHRDASAYALLAAASVAAVIPYAIYRPYDHWETLRFILPLLVVSTLVAIVGLFKGARRSAGAHAGPWLAIACTLVFVALWVRWLDRHQVLTLERAEERFGQAGELVVRATPGHAVIMASLHSGSLRYYAKRQTLDWAKIPQGQFERTVIALEAAGMPVFLMLDGEEEVTAFERRHGRVIDDRAWLPAGQRRDIRLYEAPAR